MKMRPTDCTSSRPTVKRRGTGFCGSKTIAGDVTNARLVDEPAHKHTPLSTPLPTPHLWVPRFPLLQPVVHQADGRPLVLVQRLGAADVALGLVHGKVVKLDLGPPDLLAVDAHLDVGEGEQQGGGVMQMWGIICTLCSRHAHCCFLIEKSAPPNTKHLVIQAHKGGQILHNSVIDGDYALLDESVGRTPGAQPARRDRLRDWNRPHLKRFQLPIQLSVIHQRNPGPPATSTTHAPCSAG